MGRMITAPGVLKNVQGQIDHLADIYDDVKDNNLKPLTITLDPVTNANGAVSVVTEDPRVTEDMKAIAIEVGTPESFKAPITVTTGNGTVTLTCSDASGTSTVKVTFIKTSPVEGGEDYPPAVTSTEFDILADRIGSLSSLDTTDKSDLVSAVNEVNSKLTSIENRVNSNKYASAVNIQSYTSTKYVCPSDGYVTGYAWNAAVAFDIFASNSDNYIASAQLPSNSSSDYGTTSVFVKKGMKIKVRKAGYSITFNPIAE